jgi:AcrR family transcriptional regulator
MYAKGKHQRKYDSPYRRAQADRTRHAILEAARTLVLARGYAATTVADIAAAAGVSAESVYAVFGSKRRLLNELIVVAVRGDEAPTPLLDRPGPLAVRDAKGQKKQLRLFARDITTILDRVGPLMEVAEEAAHGERELAAVVRTLYEDRLRNMRTMVEWIAARGSLRHGLGVDEAAETAWALTSPALYGLMTRTLGWSRERYADWLESSLAALLLPPAQD